MADQPYYASNDGGSPNVVQGTVIDSKQNYDTEATWTKQEETRKNRFNDVFWAILFFCNLGAVAFMTFVYVPQMYAMSGDIYNDYSNGGGRRLDDGGGNANYANDDAAAGGGGADYNGQQDVNPVNILILVGLAGVTTLLISSVTLTFMMNFAEGLIKTALIFNVVATGVMAVLALLSGQIMFAVFALAMFAFTAYYAYHVWSRIPFAACNMTTAVTAVKENLGVTFFAYNSLLVLLGWNVWFFLCFGSYVAVTDQKRQQAGQEQADPVFGVVVFFLFLSFYWTYEVVKNHLHVTVAGTVGTWWFIPHSASSCCSSAVRDSFFRASTYSFGSICFGSLIVAIIQTIKEMAHQARENGDGIALCIVECILGCIQDLVEYFNQWAYVYVGLYGYSFIEAGKNVITLFKERGWTTIITDNLIDRVLGMMSFVIGLIMGVVCIAVAAAFGMAFGDPVLNLALPFFIGLLTGSVLSSMLMGVVGSAVNTVIVCYAEAPNEFQTNHPELSNEMRQAWRQAWPVEFNY